MPLSPAFPYESRWVDVHGTRMHYVEQGAGDPVLFIHGNPTSAYLWRNVMPYASRQGRAIAVDLVGMGGSGKPELGYRFADHLRYVEGFIDALGLDRVRLVTHDWGGALGMSWARRHPERVRGVAFMETVVVPFEWSRVPLPFRVTFAAMRHPVIGDWLNVRHGFFLRVLLPGLVVRGLTREEKSAYYSPFRTAQSRRPVAQWPREIPFSGQPADVHEEVTANYAWLSTAPVPKLLLHADPGSIITAPLVRRLKREITGLQDVAIGRGRHYVQEDEPDRIGRALEEWLGRQP